MAAHFDRPFGRRLERSLRWEFNDEEILLFAVNVVRWVLDDVPNLLDEHPFRGIKIVEPAEFLTLIRD
ncbi:MULTISPECIES: hypothetical protein [unclassified Haloferax]|uniref:hypothetical protein n=1 Tax=unclassified Haloferax TaxID=2625095 RepID=UPI0011C05DD8|nr:MULTISPECIES: hypothetical protein [unclassified Haloferax]